MRWCWIPGLCLLAACELRGGLTHAQLYGNGPPDAAFAADTSAPPPPGPDAGEEVGAPAPDAGADAGPPDRAPALPARQLITITGTVFIKNCGGGANVNVGAGGRHTCSHGGKGGYVLRVMEVPYTTITISAQRAGFTPFPYSAPLFLDPMNATHNIELEYQGDCAEISRLPPCVCAPAEQCDPS